MANKKAKREFAKNYPHVITEGGTLALTAYGQVQSKFTAREGNSSESLSPQSRREIIRGIEDKMQSPAVQHVEKGVIRAVLDHALLSGDLPPALRSDRVKFNHVHAAEFGTGNKALVSKIEATSVLDSVFSAVGKSYHRGAQAELDAAARKAFIEERRERPDVGSPA